MAISDDDREERAASEPRQRAGSGAAAEKEGQPDQEQGCGERQFANRPHQREATIPIQRRLLRYKSVTAHGLRSSGNPYSSPPIRPRFRLCDLTPQGLHLRGARLLALLGAVAQPARAASAGTPCWKVLLNDWYDGRIDGSYPRHCYNDALKHLPADVSTYSSAHDDILRALQSAIAKQEKAGHKVGPNTLIVPPASPTKGSAQRHDDDRPRPKGTRLASGPLNPGSPSSLPMPLLVLGGLALLLVAAGGAGLIAKRIQARRENP